jgi:hypothetical protein
LERQEFKSPFLTLSNSSKSRQLLFGWAKLVKCQLL